MIAFISGGELRTRWDQNPVLDFSFPQLRVLLLLPSYRTCGPCIGGMFRSPATILSFIGQILTSWRRDLIREWILRTHHGGVLFVDFVAPWGQRNSRLTRSARLRNHETRLCEEQGARGGRLIENPAWQGHTSPPAPSSAGHPVAGPSVNMVKFAAIKMQVRSPSVLTLVPLISA